MPARLTARVTYSNGIAAQGVNVTLLDRDASGKKDDDLTITPGITNRQGVFTLEYDPARYQDSSQVSVSVPRNPPFDWTLETRTRVVMDPADLYTPYLHFSYQYNGVQTTFSADMKSGQTSYVLPEILQVRMIPSQHGWKFVNAFSGFFLPFSLPMIPGLSNPGSVYGLCGGMSAGALDMFLDNHPIPATSKVPRNGSSIQKYLYKRQMDSMGILGETILHFADWMGLPDSTPHGTQKLTLDEFENKIRPRLDAFTPTPIGMLYVKWSDTHEVWLNHQVLAIRYEQEAPGHFRIYIYDPNYPTRDDVYIDARTVDVGGDSGLSLVQCIGSTEKKKLYAIMTVPYSPLIPPANL
jgi:hypothetical protein